LKSYSQNYQDLFILKIIKYHGFFVDIGANDGITFSNTYLLEQKGWDGICVEANPVFRLQLQANRKCESYIAAVTNKPIDYVSFLQILGPSHMLSGIVDFFDGEQLQRIENEILQTGGSKNIITIPTFSFEQIKSESIDYLSIDIEGAELEILKSLDFDKYFIKMISVENNSPKNQLKQFLMKKNFKHLINLGGDQIWINKRCKKIKGIIFPSLIVILSFYLMDRINRGYHFFKRKL